MELKFKNSNMTCFQIVQIDQESKKYIMDTSTMSPKSYYWGIKTIRLQWTWWRLKRIIPSSKLNLQHLSVRQWQPSLSNQLSKLVMMF